MDPSERSVMDPVRTEAAAQPPPPGMVTPRSRWRGSTTTFGPVGRLVMTLLLFVPAWWFWEVQLFAWPGLIIWAGFLMPWALRDVWKATRVRSD